MAKYTGDYNYKGELKRIRSGRYEYYLNGRTYHIKSIPWMNRYGHWEARSGEGFCMSSNYLWLTVANIDRSVKNAELQD